LSYTHFTLSERFCLQEFLNQGKSFREIAKSMGRSPSTISREVKRNWSKKKNRYNPWRATTLYIIRRRNCVRKPAIKKDTELYRLIKECLELYWSPEIIANHCKQKGYHISFSSIYTAIKSGLFSYLINKPFII
jgi:IS30 family transposase